MFFYLHLNYIKTVMKKSKFNVCAIDMNIEISYAIRRQELKKRPF